MDAVWTMKQLIFINSGCVLFFCFLFLSINDCGRDSEFFLLDACERLLSLLQRRKIRPESGLSGDPVQRKITCMHTSPVFTYEGILRSPVRGVFALVLAFFHFHYYERRRGYGKSYPRKVIDPAYCPLMPCNHMERPGVKAWGLAQKPRRLTRDLCHLDSDGRTIGTLETAASSSDV